MKKKLSIISLVLLMFSTFVLAGCAPRIVPQSICYCNDDATFACLQRAFERRWVRRRDIRNIAYIHNDGEVINSRGRVLNFTPTVDTNPVMCEDLRGMLEDAWGRPLHIQRYYGTFGEFVVFAIPYGTAIMMEFYYIVSIADVLFTFETFSLDRFGLIFVWRIEK